jgi:hypothetical protein
MLLNNSGRHFFVTVDAGAFSSRKRYVGHGKNEYKQQ